MFWQKSLSIWSELLSSQCYKKILNVFWVLGFLTFLYQKTGWASAPLRLCSLKGWRYFFLLYHQLLNAYSNELYLREYYVHVWKLIETFVQKDSHLQDQCFPLQKQAYNSTGSCLVHVGVFQSDREDEVISGWLEKSAGQLRETLGECNFSWQNLH